jgi:phosphoglycerate dehydrogenase-like enzyme
VTSVVVLSRQGTRTLAWDDVVRLERVADVRYHELRCPPSGVEAIALLEGAEILATTNACMPTLDTALLDALPMLRAVVLYATGYDHVDVELLASRGIVLSVLPDYATNAVAEHAMAMLLSMATRLHLAHGRSRGTAPSDASLRGIELAGRTMGVLGVGRIGMRVAQLGAAFGMRVLGYDDDTAAIGAARHEGITMTGRDRVLAKADALMVCASHSYDAPAVIGLDELDRMRSDAFVVNVARAALVDTAAATAAIRAGAIRGYAVDDVVLDPDVDGDLLAEGRVLQTAHSAWWRDEVLDRGRRMWAQHLLAVIEGRPLDAVTWPSSELDLTDPTDGASGRWDRVVDDDDELVAAP